MKAASTVGRSKKAKNQQTTVIPGLAMKAAVAGREDNRNMQLKVAHINVLSSFFVIPSTFWNKGSGFHIWFASACLESITLSRDAPKHTSKQEGKQTSKGENEQTSKRANEQTGKQASKRANEKANQQMHKLVI